MLVKCPECNNEVSDKSNQCIHCGFPLEKIKSYSMINGKQYDFNDIIESIKMATTPALGCRIISDLLESDISLMDTKAIYDIIKSTGKAPDEYNCENSNKTEVNVPRCPICNSTNLSKITATKKVTKIATFGIFGMGDNGKTWKCNNCGSKF